MLFDRIGGLIRFSKLYLFKNKTELGSIYQNIDFDNPKAKIPDRIVSIYKPYIRPIVRGKENKPVEFGIIYPK